MERHEATLYHAAIAERARRNAEQDREELPKALSKFIAAAWPVIKPEERYHHNWHIDAVCHHLEAVTAGEITRLQVWIPPGTMKSMTISVFWHCWEWTMKPWLRYWGASYETRLAGRMSSMARDLMNSPWYKERWQDSFRFDRLGEHYYSNDRGGTRLATAPQSTGSGEHGHRIIIDDPINAKAADATSRHVLNETNDWYDGTVVTRGIGSDHARVLVMQRLHENDFAAHLLKQEEWVVLCLPERYEANHPFAWPDDPRQEGELLWPEHRDEKLSNALAASLTSHRAAGQLQQRPAAREGEILKRDWWRFYDPRIRAQERWKELGQMQMVVISADCPAKDKETSDNVAIQCWGAQGADNYLLDLRLGKMNYGLAKRTIREMALWSRKLWKGIPHYVLIENAGYGVELIVDLKRELSGVTKIPAQKEGNKETRAESASDGLESGNYFLPGYGKPWQPAYDEHNTPADVRAFIQSCASFPHGVHDDDVDAWSQYGNWRRSRTVAPIRTSKLPRVRQLLLPSR